jgi:sRNA-binding carbon storage regulator CsrA
MPLNKKARTGDRILIGKDIEIVFDRVGDKTALVVINAPKEMSIETFEGHLTKTVKAKIATRKSQRQSQVVQPTKWKPMQLRDLNKARAGT